jgi:hypothetical protein
MRSVSHIVFRWISAVFTGIECILRVGDWPSLYGILASQGWLVVTGLLVAPEIAALVSGRTRLGELSAAAAERIRYYASVACVGLSAYLLYLTGGGDSLPGEHF